MKYALRVTNTFGRELKRLSERDRERVLSLIEEVQESPYEYKPLSGQLSGARSARAGDLRLIYTVDDVQKLIVLLFVGHRERVYERR